MLMKIPSVHIPHFGSSCRCTASVRFKKKYYFWSQVLFEVHLWVHFSISVFVQFINFLDMIIMPETFQSYMISGSLQQLKIWNILHQGGSSRGCLSVLSVNTTFLLEGKNHLSLYMYSLYYRAKGPGPSTGPTCTRVKWPEYSRKTKFLSAIIY